MLKRIVSTSWVLPLPGIGAALLWVITKDLTEQDRNDIAESFHEANYWWVVLSVVIGIISHIFRALRVADDAQTPLGHEPRLITTFASVMVAYWHNLAVPRLGEGDPLRHHAAI